MSVIAGNLKIEKKYISNYNINLIFQIISRCKCASTCLNRVVQHPLQLKLQVKIYLIII